MEGCDSRKPSGAIPQTTGMPGSRSGRAFRARRASSHWTAKYGRSVRSVRPRMLHITALPSGLSDPGDLLQTVLLQSVVSEPHSINDDCTPSGPVSDACVPDTTGHGMNTSHRVWQEQQDHIAARVRAQMHHAGRVEEDHGDLDEHYDRAARPRPPRGEPHRQPGFILRRVSARTDGGDRVDHPRPDTGDRNYPGGSRHRPPFILILHPDRPTEEDHPGPRQRLTGGAAHEAIEPAPRNTTPPWPCT